MIASKDVTKFYPEQDRPALRNINPGIAKDGFIFLMGQSGSGKSTFLRLILREYQPTKGMLYVVGKNPSILNRWKAPVLRRQIGTMFQDFRLLPGRTVYRSVAFALQVIGRPSRVIREVIPEVLRLVDLEGEENRLNEELSDGEQQRAVIARVFVNRPKILVADEPAGDLDPEASVGIVKLLGRVNRTETTVIMATRDSSVADQIRRRILELRRGKLMRDQARGIYNIN